MQRGLTYPQPHGLKMRGIEREARVESHTTTQGSEARGMGGAG